MAAAGGRTRPLRCFAIRVLISASRSGRNRFNPDEIQTVAGIHDHLIMKNLPLNHLQWQVYV